MNDVHRHFNIKKVVQYGSLRWTNILHFIPVLVIEIKMAPFVAQLLPFILTWATVVRAQSGPPYAVDPPTTAPSDTIQDCTNWAVASSTDTCQTIANSNFITLAQLNTYVR